MSNSNYNSLVSALNKYMEEGGNIICDGGEAYFDEDTRERDHSDLDKLFGTVDAGYRGNSDYRIQVSDNSHSITKHFELNEYVTEHLVNGLNIQQFQDQGQVLLSLTNERQSYPFLSIHQTAKNRIALVNDFSTYSGVPAIFRNDPPQVFYKNLIYEVLIETVYWSVYGNIDTPILSLQVSNANLNAIIRLDADGRGNLNAQIRTINYLNDIARETGVVSLYGWVSSGATKAGWQDLGPLGKKLEDLGGQIGTHSKFHRIDRQMNERRWKEELDDAIREIEFNMSDYGNNIGKVDCFINPGNTIPMDDYNQVAKRFKFYMTHGFEQNTPIGFGNFTWYTEDSLNFVVLENTPSPDYQWFYDPSWSYTTQQITAYEENIYDHLFYNVQRGVIYNQMWHDYSIISQSQRKKDRIVNENNLPMYDAIKSKFYTTDIYCPTPIELQNKLVTMAQGDYSWESNGNELVLNLDLSKVRLKSVLGYTGGMGIRINHTGMIIQSVTINGQEHDAYSENVVILPNLDEPTAEIKIILGIEHPKKAHLQYVSKRMPAIGKNGSDLMVTLLTKSKGRFGFYAPSGYVVLNADWFEWNRKGNNRLNGYVTSDRTVTLKKLKLEGLTIRYSELLISDIKENGSEIIFTLPQAEAQQNKILRFSSVNQVRSVQLNNQVNEPQKDGDQYILNLDLVKGDNKLVIRL